MLYPQISARPSSDSGGPVTDLSACYPSLVLPCELHLPVGGGGFRCPGAIYISPEEGLSLPKRFCFSRHGVVHARAFSCCPRGLPSPSPPAPPYHSHLCPCGRALLPPPHGLLLCLTPSDCLTLVFALSWFKKLLLPRQLILVFYLRFKYRFEFWEDIWIVVTTGPGQCRWLSFLHIIVGTFFIPTMYKNLYKPCVLVWPAL